ncbi:MAG: hypothetical protein UU23_C0005G0007 [Candidatus Curtissbacteria bacterium GW2011_GWA1_40_9]|uniref:Uncharacterized protein n=1 Tax=Candidatus Curtissbacteria bacterium GW2011_GWA1_40_9 TaxID=1618408 RepID=A0A0G0TLT8_9BACT|nr:MAG: hypothetical protein UU23_C0005G0007 [Candidatus Curtissbacteria bacterium GW2011_GWA1_40_9]
MTSEVVNLYQELEIASDKSLTKPVGQRIYGPSNDLVREEWEWDDYDWTLLMAQFGPIYKR